MRDSYRPAAIGVGFVGAAVLDIYVTKGWATRGMLAYSAGNAYHSAEMQSYWRDRGNETAAQKYEQEGAVATKDLVIVGGLAGVARLARGLKTFNQLCFVKGTLITTLEGYKEIEKLKVGDEVWSYNESIYKNELKKVIALSKNTVSEIIEINAEGVKIECTPEHPFYVGGKWVEAKDLKAEDRLYLKDGSKLEITFIQKNNKKQEVYNFEVEDNHNYYVSDKQILVHNDCFGFKITKAVNSNMPHAVERGLERGIFATEQEASTAIKETSDWITKNKDFPVGSIKDPSYSDRVLVPIGNNGMAAYQIGKNGSAKLKTVLNAK